MDETDPDQFAKQRSSEIARRVEGVDQFTIQTTRQTPAIVSFLYSLR